MTFLDTNKKTCSCILSTLSHIHLNAGNIFQLEDIEAVKVERICGFTNSLNPVPILIMNIVMKF